MGKERNISYTVNELEAEIQILHEAYIKAMAFESIKHLFKQEKEFEIHDIIYGIWQHYIVLHLPSNNLPIWGYYEKEITLNQYLEGKISIINDWDMVSIFERFNSFVLESANLQELADDYGIKSSLLTMSINGREWIKRLQYDENNGLLTATEEKLAGIETENRDLLVEQALDEYERVKKLVKENPDKYDQLLVRYEEISFREKGCKFKSGKLNKAGICSCIRNLTGISQKTIEKRLERYLISEGKLPPRIKKKKARKNKFYLN